MLAPQGLCLGRGGPFPPKLIKVQPVRIGITTEKPCLDSTHRFFLAARARIAPMGHLHVARLTGLGYPCYWLVCCRRGFSNSEAPECLLVTGNPLCASCPFELDEGHCI
jgi:hypothetical protein